MKREYPSTPEEAFEASIEGAYYAEQMAQAELQGRVGPFKALPELPVHTAWDIGVGDATAIWFLAEAEGQRSISWDISKLPAKVFHTTSTCWSSIDAGSAGPTVGTSFRRMRA